jgi:hypothetical protein
MVFKRAVHEQEIAAYSKSQKPSLNSQKFARQQNNAVIADTTHSDLAEDLKPSVLVHKRFGEEIHIDYYPKQTTWQQCAA